MFVKRDLNFYFYFFFFSSCSFPYVMPINKLIKTCREKKDQRRMLGSKPEKINNDSLFIFWFYLFMFNSFKNRMITILLTDAFGSDVITWWWLLSSLFSPSLSFLHLFEDIFLQKRKKNKYFFYFDFYYAFSLYIFIFAENIIIDSIIYITIALIHVAILKIHLDGYFSTKINFHIFITFFIFLMMMMMF